MINRRQETFIKWEKKFKRGYAETSKIMQTCNILKNQLIGVK